MGLFGLGKKTFMQVRRADGLYITQAEGRLSGSWGEGGAQEVSVSDFLFMLAREYEWLAHNGTRLSPALAARLERITRFFGGEEPMPETKAEIRLVTEWSPHYFRHPRPSSFRDRWPYGWN